MFTARTQRRKNYREIAFKKHLCISYHDNAPPAYKFLRGTITLVILPRPEGRGYNNFAPTELFFLKAISLARTTFCHLYFILYTYVARAMIFSSVISSPETSPEIVPFFMTMILSHKPINSDSSLEIMITLFPSATSDFTIS
jgi:hypothetical protein